MILTNAPNTDRSPQTLITLMFGGNRIIGAGAEHLAAALKVNQVSRDFCSDAKRSSTS